jgi:3-oxoacyl-[acyl-carrier-protein] synthase III
MAFQIFGNGAGVIGVIPGKTMRYLVGKAHEVFDKRGTLAVKMYYPHSGQYAEGTPMIEVFEDSENHIRFAGLMPEPDDGTTVVMAGPMGMVKLFVRTGVQVVRDVYQEYQAKMNEIGSFGKQKMVAIVHHANYKINRLTEKHLKREGIHLEMPWVVSEFGNVSAASNMIAFLRELPKLKSGDHVLFDGFGAGTYYDAFAVALGQEIDR